MEGAERAERAERARRRGDGVEGFGLLETFFGRKSWKKLGKSDTPCTRAKPRGRRIEDAREAGHTAAPVKVDPRGHTLEGSGGKWKELVRKGSRVNEEKEKEKR